METLIPLLRPLLGREALVEGRRVQAVDLIADNGQGLPALVLREMDGPRVVQLDAHGDPRRRTPRTWTLPLCSELRHAIHPVVGHFLQEDERQALEDGLRAEGIIKTR